MKFLNIQVLLVLSVFICFSSCKDSPSDVETPDTQMPAANFECTDGLSNDFFPCKNISMYAHISNAQLGGTASNDIWGWTDPMTNKEYALVGLTDGVSFVDISNPVEPIIVGKLEESLITDKFKNLSALDFPGCFIGVNSNLLSKKLEKGSIWRDMKVHNNHMYVVSDNQAHGMQVFDLTRLRSYDGTPLSFSHDALYDKFAGAHNVAINENTGFAFVTGVTTSDFCGQRDSTGIHIVDINSPLTPTFAGCYFDAETDLQSFPNIGVGYIHDTQCVNYQGPDTEHQGKEVCFSSAEGAVVISDVSDKSSPTTIGFSGLTQMQYSHQGWLTEDHSYFLMNDELDESNLNRNTKTYIWNVKNLDSPSFIGHYDHTTTSTDHNLYVKGDYMYQSNYAAGLRVLRIDDLDNIDLEEVAYFDTQPSTDHVNADGSWSNYPFFESGVIIVSDIVAGLFVLKPEF